jgi:adenylate kinase family enzyme
MAKPMRIAVVGTSGSGKSTLVKRISDTLRLPVIDLDAINWQAGWRDLNSHDPDLFKARIAEAAAAESWVSDGNYGRNAQPILFARATDIVWLDYARPLVMARVIRRSFRRALSSKELWPGTGNVERFSDWLDSGHPIRWAWTTHAEYRAEYGGLKQAPPPHLQVHQLRRPADADRLLESLAA